MKEQVKKVLEGTDSGTKFNAGLSPRQSLLFQDMTELQLIELCQRGDRAAFRQLIKTNERYAKTRSVPKL